MAKHPTVTLEAPRHVCNGCGVCCVGTHPTLVDGEAARISKLGTELGIANPVVDNAPRFEHGTCVFLSEDNQCTLHRHFGPEAKPHRCQDFPLKRIGVENQLRVGVDPSCSTSWQTWKTGPIIGPEQLEGLITTPVPWSEPDIRMESPLLRILGGSIAAALYGLSGQRQQGRGLPQGFNQRIIETMQSIRLRQFLDHHEIGHKRPPRPQTSARLARVVPGDGRLRRADDPTNGVLTLWAAAPRCAWGHPAQPGGGRPLRLGRPSPPGVRAGDVWLDQSHPIPSDVASAGPKPRPP